MLRVTQELIDWYKIKDLIIRQDLRDIPKALKLAKSSKHPYYAAWLGDFGIYDEEDLCDILEQFPNDGTALYFYGVLRKCKYSLKKAVEMGNIHAMWCNCDGSDIDLIKNLAEKGQRDACYEYGLRTNDFKYIEYAAKLGNYFAMMQMAASQNDVYSIEYWEWICFAGEYGHFKYSKGSEDCPFNSPPAIRYMCGKRLSKSRHKEFYLSQNDKCRKAVDTWTIVATRMRIYKDLRKLIGGMIWNSRSGGIYKEE